MSGQQYADIMFLLDVPDVGPRHKRTSRSGKTMTINLGLEFILKKRDPYHFLINEDSAIYQPLFSDINKM